MEKLLNALRHGGWSVAIHNDYRLKETGKKMTFWLLTSDNGRIYLKGEGDSDLEALKQCAVQAGWSEIMLRELLK